MAYRPIERGFLLQSHHIIDTLVEKYKKSKTQIVLNRLISKNNIITIVKSTNIDHLKENLGAIGWNLSPEDIQLLDKTPFEIPTM